MPLLPRGRGVVRTSPTEFLRPAGWPISMVSRPLTPVQRLAVGAQAGQADLAGETQVRAGVAEPDDLVEQRRGPQVRVVGEPGD